MDDFRIYEFVDAEDLEIPYFTLELLRKAEGAGLVVSLADGLAYLDELMSGNSGEERCLSTAETYH